MRSYFPFTLAAAFLLLASFVSYSQQPGGVSGTKIWYVTNTVGDKNILKDISGNSEIDFTSSTGSEANLNINFHPAVFFESRVNDKSIKNLLLSQFTVIGAYYPDPSNYKGNDFIGITANKKTTSLQYNLIDTNSNTKYQYGSKLNRTTFEIFKPLTLTENSMKTAIYYGASKKLNNSIWKPKQVSSLYSDFNGYIPELIIYNRNLSQLEVLQVQTYLAIKYGTTLDTSYVGSDSSILWNINDPTFKTFHHRVCAIGKDFKAALFQPKSNTTYEEEFINPKSIDSRRHIVNSYWYDADDFTLRNNWKFIPEIDSPSLYRSITINFKDKSLNTLQDKKFIFLGDDSLSIRSDQFKAWFSEKYPYLKTVQRKWLLYNKNNLINPVHIVISGVPSDDYSPPILFNTIYDPYDYQLYRFVLVRFKTLNPLQIDTLQLCSYFGREQLSNNRFNTKTIVWDSLVWKDAYNYFTIGKVPILNFLQFGKTATSQLIDLKYPYYADSAIQAETNFDTVTSSSKKEFIFKPNEPITAYFRISEGVARLSPTLYVLLANNTWSEVKNAIVKVGDSTVITTDTREENESTDTTTNDNIPPIPPPMGKKKLEQIERHKPIANQSYKAYNVSKLQAGKTYKIVVTDTIMQKTSILFKTIVK